MISNFSNIIKYNLQKFFEDYIIFITQHKQLITNYYTKGEVYPKKSFDLLSELINQSKTIISKISINREYLINFSDFEITDRIEEIIHCIEIMSNYSRWLRSSLFKGKFKQKAEINVILKQNQTLESFSEEIGYLDRDQGAIDIATRNNIKETDITTDGGLVFRFNYYNSDVLKLNSIVDNLYGNNLLGKDLDRYISFTTEDLDILTPEDTFYQTCFILSSLIKGDNPEFSNIGFDKSTLNNRNTMNTMLPSFIRQLYNITSDDDSISSFKVNNIYYDKDALNIEITFRSWLNNEIKQTINGN